MKQPRRVLLLLTVLLSVALGATLLVYMRDLGRGDVPGLALGALGLVVSIVTLWFVVPTPAEMIVVRQDELELNDLIFYLADLPEGRVPRDYLLQLHVAVANIGGRKGVVSRVTIEEFRGASGARINLPGATTQHSAVRYARWTGWRNSTRYSESIVEPGPWLLAPDDVITLRFRTRRGINWSPQIDLAKLREIHDALDETIVSASGIIVWRQGKVTRQEPFVVRVDSVQQDEYVEALRQLTEGFTIRPAIPPQPFEIE